ncbi:hypothetical protein NADFUDRAFT_82297 [Nadsonia fulvescens var. elongata DSM 6958]|uniref:Ribosome biogenesis protein ALB1 n=1 Tax=Nadsonia fulvescens var. elongata DSM 6958 TaxID=857566 RepID=A0A1E3PMS3_9ASCO|nr:hypothetical protein NADFUDRAFT_82297 [Nadsonia fulvescens var. elongata DSM 6958]
MPSTFNPNNAKGQTLRSKKSAHCARLQQKVRHNRITTKVITKKRAKKDVRNNAYMADYIKEHGTTFLTRKQVECFNKSQAGTGVLAIEGAPATETTTRTQLKKRAQKEKLDKLKAISLVPIDDIMADSMELTSSGKGTTLGGPSPVAV